MLGAGVGIGARSIDRGGPKDKPHARADGARHLKSLLCFARHATSCRLHASPRHRPRQALRAAPPARLGRRPPARPLRREGARPRQGRRDLHRRARRRAAARRRDPVLRADAARRRLPRLGDAALRHLLAARGPDLRAAGDALAHPARRRRRRPDAGDDGARPPRAAGVHGRLHLPLHDQAAPRRGGAEGAAHARRLHPREPGRLAGRVRGARRADRPVPDGLGGAVPRRPVRRRDRFDPHLRPRHAAKPLSGARGSPPARPRVPDGRAGAQRVPGALARALRGRPDQGAPLQGHRRRHRHRRHRVLPAALLRRDGDRLRLPRRRGDARAARRDRRGAAALLGRHARAPSLLPARPRAADPGARSAVPQARGVLHRLRRARAADAARQERRRASPGRPPCPTSASTAARPSR